MITYHPIGGTWGLPEISDEQLLQAIAQKDQQAMMVFYDRYFGKVKGLCHRMIQNREIADETVQDIFWTVWQNADKYDAHRASCSTWLLVIARSRCMDQLRKIKNIPVADSIDDLSDELADGGKEVVEDVIQKMGQHALQSAMTLLPDAQRTVVTDVYLIGFSAPQVARARGLPLGTVKTRLRLGLEKLRAILREEVSDAEP